MHLTNVKTLTWKTQCITHSRLYKQFIMDDYKGCGPILYVNPKKLVLLLHQRAFLLAATIVWEEKESLDSIIRKLISTKPNVKKSKRYKCRLHFNSVTGLWPHSYGCDTQNWRGYHVTGQNIPLAINQKDAFNIFQIRNSRQTIARPKGIRISRLWNWIHLPRPVCNQFIEVSCPYTYSLKVRGCNHEDPVSDMKNKSYYSKQ